MAPPAASQREPVAPPPEPIAIRSCLTPDLVAEFDAEWEAVLDAAKHSKELAGVQSLLSKWRHIAFAELKDPGSHQRLLAKAEQIIRTGANPDAVPVEHLRVLIAERLGR